MPIQPYAKAEFNLKRGKAFEFDIEINSKSKVAVYIGTADKDPIKQLAKPKKYKKGSYTFSWDGKDAKKQMVANEAYYPMLLIKKGKKEIWWHPADESGGEVIQPVVTITDKTLVQFKLEEPSRILARAGIKGGALLRTLVAWKPYPTGANNLAWNGMDESNQYRFVDHKDYSVMVTGYKLPRHAILVSGGNKKSYSAWRESHKWTKVSINEPAILNQSRDNQSISRMFYEPRYQPYDPRVNFKYLHLKEQKPNISEMTTVVVDIPKADKKVLEESLFEVGFFVDGEFVSEEEQGYVPFTWNFDPRRFGPGEHVLTVNISGFSGQVGSASLLFSVPNNSK